MSNSPLATDDASPRKTLEELSLASGTEVAISDDHFSDRIRCDHPLELSDLAEAEALGRELVREAKDRQRGRIVTFVPERLAPGLEASGFEAEGVMPGFYEGEEDCVALGYYLNDERGELAEPEAVAKVKAILEAKAGTTKPRPPVETILAETTDAPAIADLLADTFQQYPTPSGDPAYVAEAIADGNPFRFVKVAGEIVACASADLVPEAATAELTDCATLPEHRGNGYMQAILMDLMDDLAERQYPTAFTLARARIPGVNLAFQRLGFQLRGTMPQSCRIGGGIEDMNIWSRTLPGMAKGSAQPDDIVAA
ncbi:MAG: GNAT family N-acetyltransferase [Deltaproteobacteria bacterium]|nr:GNAT family N-acetyltransferase [Deltaproteobacteria bacterium]